MNRLAKTAFACLALIASNASGCCVAHAGGAEMPRYDVETHCRTVASFGGSYSAALDKACMEMEQKAYDALKPVWPQAGAAGAHCDEVARFGGTGSYSLLETCIDMETTAGKTKPKFKF